MNITASILYDYTQCPHRVWRDVYGPLDEKIKGTNPFVQLLWDKGAQFEEEIIKEIGIYEDLSKGDLDVRFQKTMEVLNQGVELIYQGVIKYDNLVGIPDLIRKMPNGYYMPIDIKAGKGFQTISEDDIGKPKEHYAVQLCLYVDILKRLGYVKEDKGLIIDIEKNEVEYLFNEAVNSRTKQTWWQYYEAVKQEVEALLNNRKQNLPANSSICKLCPWYFSCRKWCEETSDMTNIFYLGRSARDTISSDLQISKVKDLCDLDIAEVLKTKKQSKGFLNRIGEKLLIKFIARAKLLNNNDDPVIYADLNLPQVTTEIFFDLEADPTQNVVYLHGFFIRSKEKEQFIPFLAESNTGEAEKKVWERAWNYIAHFPKDDYAIYYYSPYEKTTYKKLSNKYPSVAREEEVESLFASNNVIDLYQIVQGKTDWPLSSYSIKDIATYLGFNWRDETPSGALSIQWYNEYLRSKDNKYLQRIIEYNEDDCKATMVLKDKLAEMKLK